jgi:epoxyqueuosine reductase
MKMIKFDRSFLQKMKEKLDVELLGVASLEGSVPAELKDKATALLPGVKSAVVVGKEIYREIIALLKPSKEAGATECGELLGPHAEYLTGRLNRAIYDLAALFKKEGYRSLPLPAAGCPTDMRFLNAIFSYKHAGVFAGLGTIGRHSLLITPEYGPRVRLACLLTEAPLGGSSTKLKDRCIDCDACIRGCPANALNKPQHGEPYSINKFACQAYRQMGFACSICMKVCDEALG